MPRFFTEDADNFENTAYIYGKDAEHIKVLRMRVGEELAVCDGKGTDYICRLIRSDKDCAEAEIIKVLPCPAEPNIFVSVFCGLPKGDKTDYIIQKSVETGASEIAFFDSERVVQRTDGVSKKLERWNRISEEAAKQCGRGIIPAVSFIDGFDSMLNAASEKDAAFFMYETGEREGLLQALSCARSIKTAAIITGPEGGFEPYEAEAARSLNMHVCSMGKRILRCETAPVVALTALMLQSGDLE